VINRKAYHLSGPGERTIVVAASAGNVLDAAGVRPDVAGFVQQRHEHVLGGAQVGVRMAAISVEEHLVNPASTVVPSVLLKPPERPM